MMSPQKRVVLCDLGGVLIDLHWLERARGLFGSEVDADELKSRWLKLNSAREYEAGKVDFAQFYQRFIAETGSPTEFSAFKNEFAGIIGPVKSGCLDILLEIRQSAELAMLSNTNPVHVQMLRQSSNIFAPFQHLFFSYEMGMVKPDHEIYHAVCASLKRSAGNVYFFDDSVANVSAARECGLNAFRVDSPQEIQEIIKGL